MLKPNPNNKAMSALGPFYDISLASKSVSGYTICIGFQQSSTKFFPYHCYLFSSESNVTVLNLGPEGAGGHESGFIIIANTKHTALECPAEITGGFAPITE